MVEGRIKIIGEKTRERKYLLKLNMSRHIPTYIVFFLNLCMIQFFFVKKLNNKYNITFLVTCKCVVAIGTIFIDILNSNFDEILYVNETTILPLKIFIIIFYSRRPTVREAGTLCLHLALFSFTYLNVIKWFNEDKTFFFFFAGDKMTQFIKSHTTAITKVEIGKMIVSCPRTKHRIYQKSIT
ncbi:hypothetical protein AGLY_013530 [Aphis glycines]|uniref:Uncharacterized protein n=1 Tax=Aphis glycines TaxID=307491 RepID=A0A6G0T7W5_APHGL|nr:hypothetical protein AGLY_013530 [Aphis glycines]